MDDKTGYAVFLFPNALETLGEGITPYLQDGKAGAHIVCREVDTGGSLLKMVLDATTTAGDIVALELLVPSSMVLMIVSARPEEAFGFGPRIAVEAVHPAGDGSSKPQVEMRSRAKPASSKPAKKSRGAPAGKDAPKGGKPTSSGAKAAKSKPAKPGKSKK